MGIKKASSEVQSALDGLIYGGTVGSYKINNKYPNLRGLMTWSINWDKYTNYNWSNYFRNYFNNLTPPTNTLKAATLSSSAVTSGNYTISAVIPGYNTATSYKIYEGTTVITTGSLTAGQASKTINYNITSKTPGTYSYKCELSDGSKTVTSNQISVTVSSSTNNNAWVPNHAYKVGDIVTYNGGTYMCRQAHTSLLGWEPSSVPALWLQQ